MENVVYADSLSNSFASTVAANISQMNVRERNSTGSCYGSSQRN